MYVCTSTCNARASLPCSASCLLGEGPIRWDSKRGWRENTEKEEDKKKSVKSKTGTYHT